LDVREIKEILKLLEEQSITEFELEQDGVKLRICRQTTSNHATPGAPESAPLRVAVAHAPGPVTVAAPLAPSPAPGPAAVEPAENESIVKSPIVGTFYRSPDPNAPAFVSVGDRVKVGQVLCIIEAMKLMNEIEAEIAGEVLRIHPENGQPVQYGDPLFTIRTGA
jgi:acetyl-CoA carboxylase biotin carboxyl carrier protein